MNSDLSTSKLNFWHWITSELSERMAQNLPFIKISPQKILLVGEFQKSTFTYFQKNYPNAQVWSDCHKVGLLENYWNLLFRRNKRIRQHLLASTSNMNEYDLVWAGPIKKEKEFFSQIEKHLKNNSLVMFNYLGPDTAKEIKSLITEQGYIGPDMHDIGDLLASLGYADPVMNMEYINLEYENSQVFIQDILSLGLISVAQATSEQFKEKIVNLLRLQPQFQLTLEVVYGHAWRFKKNDAKTIKIYPKESFKNVIN